MLEYEREWDYTWITKIRIGFSKLIQIFGEIFNSAAGHDEMQPFRKQCHKSLHFMLFADFMILLFKYPAAAIVGDVIRDARAISVACKLVMFAA